MALSRRARSIPWDCSDWQPFAHEDRTTAILETLAENRGKTLYCGIDQSDTFSKAETWEAGKDRNERDDTVYWGERGSFRGFIAAQEGWLTEGESGITGQSEATIFEFPKEEQRGRRKKVKRIDIGTDPTQFPITAVASCGQLLGILCTEESSIGNFYSGNEPLEKKRARNKAANLGQNATYQHIEWDTQTLYTEQVQSGVITSRTRASNQRVRPTTAEWTALAAAAADRACRDQGYRYAAGSAQIGMGHSNDRGPISDDLGPGLGFFLRKVTSGANFQYHGRQSRTWTATCKKVLRGSRR